MGYDERAKRSQAMSHDNGQAPSPFQAPAGTQLVGQPFTLANLSMPVSGQLTCNCGGADTTLTFIASATVTCPACRKTYTPFFNPMNGQLQVAIVLPKPEAPRAQGSEP